MAHCLQSTAAEAELLVWFWTLTIVIWGVWRTEFVLTALPVFTLVRTLSIIVESRCDCCFVCFREPERLEHFIAFLLHKQHLWENPFQPADTEPLTYIILENWGRFLCLALSTSDLNFMRSWTSLSCRKWVTLTCRSTEEASVIVSRTKLILGMKAHVV